MFQLEKCLIPKPKQMKDFHKECRIAKVNQVECCIQVENQDPLVSEAAKLIQDKIIAVSAYSGSMPEEGYPIFLRVDAKAECFTGEMPAESYFVEITPEEAVLCGIDPAGLFYAAQTFVSLLHTQGDEVWIPQTQIADWPDFPNRGHFMECRWGSEFLTREDWYDIIDYLASTKCNQLTIGIYGCWNVQYDERMAEYFYLPISKYPQLKTYKNIKYYSVREHKWVHQDHLLPYIYEQDFFGDVIKYGKLRNVTVKPLFNSLGHNSLIPKMIPEISAKMENGEPTGSGFCTCEEKTYEVMCDIYSEIIEKYLKPNGIKDIEIGFDEVLEQDLCHCEKCRDRKSADLMVDYIVRLCKFLKEKGMKRVYIYHDMLFHHYDLINEDLKKRFQEEGIYDLVVLDWWNYEDPSKLFWGKEEKVNGLFHSVAKPFAGYFHWVIPTQHNENVRAMTRTAKKHGFEGVESYGAFDECFDKNFLTIADVSWNAEHLDEIEEFDERYAYRCYPHKLSEAKKALKAMDAIMMDETHEGMHNRAVGFEYYLYCYKRDHLDYPRNFPGEVYQMIKEKEEEYVPYLEFLKKNAKEALDFFEADANASEMNDVWTLTARHYYILADEYLTLWGLQKSYQAEQVDAQEVLRQLERLITQREAVMSLAERIKRKANAYTYLRNMSVFRQLMLDLQRYFETELECGRKPRLELTDLRYATGETLRFLQ